MDTAIFRVSEYIVNSFIYCCLIFNTIKRTCSIKSLMFIGTRQQGSSSFVSFAFYAIRRPLSCVSLSLSKGPKGIRFYLPGLFF